MSNACSCPRYTGPSLFGAFMQSVRDRRPDAVVWCACIGWRDTERPAVATDSPYGPVITALSPMHYPSDFHKPAGHSVTFSYAGAHGYPYRAECACGWISKSYAAVHAARTMADEHIAEMTR
jgi:hypothetical protein